MKIYEDRMAEGPRLLTVIASTTRRGGGKRDDDPVRIVHQYFTLEGDLLAECDHWMDERKSVGESCNCERGPMTNAICQKCGRYG